MTFVSSWIFRNLIRIDGRNRGRYRRSSIASRRSRNWTWKWRAGNSNNINYQLTILKCFLSLILPVIINFSIFSNTIRRHLYFQFDSAKNSTSFTPLHSYLSLPINITNIEVMNAILNIFFILDNNSLRYNKNWTRGTSCIRSSIPTWRLILFRIT